MEPFSCCSTTKAGLVGVGVRVMVGVSVGGNVCVTVGVCVSLGVGLYSASCVAVICVSDRGGEQAAASISATSRMKGFSIAFMECFFFDESTIG